MFRLARRQFSDRAVLDLGCGGFSGLPHFDHELLTAHMVQHLLLMTFAPPLIWLGEPASRASVRDLPVIRGRDVAVLTAGQTIRKNNSALCWLAAAAALVGWHVPAVFALGMHSAAWHLSSTHLSLRPGLLFWWPVVQPWPSVFRPRCVDAPVSLSRHVAMRRSFRISGLFRPRRLSVLFCPRHTCPAFLLSEISNVRPP